MFHPKWKRRPKGQYIYFSSAYTTSQRGGGGRVVCGVDFYREGSRMKEEEQLTCVRLASWLAGDGTIRHFDALQMATTFFLAGRERRACILGSLPRVASRLDPQRCKHSTQGAEFAAVASLATSYDSRQSTPEAGHLNPQEWSGNRPDHLLK